MLHVTCSMLYVSCYTFCAVKINYNCIMKLIVGLGNPGKEHENNRHNVGFMLIDYLAQLLSHTSNRTVDPFNLSQGKQSNSDFVFSPDKYLKADIYKTNNIILAKPNTFMNNSGLAVKHIVSRFTLALNEVNVFHVLSDLIVAHDDLDIPLGKFKIQIANGP